MEDLFLRTGWGLSVRARKTRALSKIGEEGLLLPFRRHHSEMSGDP